MTKKFIKRPSVFPQSFLKRLAPRFRDTPLPAQVVLTLPYGPSANRYWRNFRGMTVMSKEAKAYKGQVNLICAQNRIQPYPGPVAVTLNIYRPQKSGDLDNKIKVTLDALNKHAFNDDSQVVELHAFRHDDKANPRIEVIVKPV